VTKRSLRFAMITTFYPPYHFGGDANYVRQLCHTLVERGHQVDVIHDVDAYQLLSPTSNPEPIEEPEGMNVYGLRSTFPGLSCLLTQQTGYPIVHGREIRKILAKGNYDVIHYHNISLVGGPGILAYGSAIKIYTAHEHWLVCQNHVLWRHDREVCDGRQCLRCAVHFKRPPQLWRKLGLLKKKMKHVDALCSPSTFSAEKHKEFGFWRPLEVLPSYIPDQESGPHETLAPRKPYFLFVGRLEKIKGLQDIIPLFTDSAPADLLVVGSGDYELELQNLAGGSPEIQFLGRYAPQDIAPLYSGAIAVLIPSIGYEVFPLVVLETFRAATPIIARQLGPFPEIIEYSKGGILFNNHEQLQQALVRLASDSSLRRSMGDAGRSAYEARWSQVASMNAYFTIIRRVAKQRGIEEVLEVLNTVQDVNTQLLSRK